MQKGVDINHLDKKNRSAFQYVINMKYTDEMLRDLYKVIFSKSKVNISVNNDWGFSLLDLAEKLPYRSELVGPTGIEPVSVFVGRISAHTLLLSLEISGYSLRPLPRLNENPLRKNCKAHFGEKCL